MKVRLEKKGAFSIAGLSVHDGHESDFSGVWDKLYAEYSMEKLNGLGSGESFGSCYDHKAPSKFSYLAGYDLKDESRAKELGLDVVNVPEAQYAVADVRGKIPQSIQAAWEHMFSVWLPQNGYQHAGTPDFELYLDGNPEDPDYEMELWVPVASVSKNENKG